MIVVDASALVHAATSRAPAAAELRHRLAAELVHAPHLIDAEAGSVLRRLVRTGSLALDHAEIALASAPALVDERHGHTGPLAVAAWALREHLRFSDALYVALAASLDATLVTGDRKIPAAPGLPCRVELVPDVA